MSRGRALALLFLCLGLSVLAIAIVRIVRGEGWEFVLGLGVFTTAQAVTEVLKNFVGESRSVIVATRLISGLMFAVLGCTLVSLFLMGKDQGLFNAFLDIFVGGVLALVGAAAIV